MKHHLRSYHLLYKVVISRLRYGYPCYIDRTNRVDVPGLLVGRNPLDKGGLIRVPVAMIASRRSSVSNIPMAMYRDGMWVV
jgi:hypothetical protein